jgi:PAS domain S-box-containing protein
MKPQRCLALLLVLFLVQSARAAEPPKLVLVLDSFGRNVLPISAVNSAFQSGLSSQSPNPIEIHEVYLEMARFDRREQEDALVNFLKERFTRRPPDLVVTMGGPAYAFLSRHRESLFPATPALNAGVAYQHVRSAPALDNAVVIAAPTEPTMIMEDILQVLPATQNIFVILGTSTLEAFWLDEFRRELAAFSHRVDFTYLNHLSYKEILARVSVLPPDSAVFYGILIVDAAGIPFENDVALKGVIAAANAPVFAMHHSYFGLGIVGGRLVRERKIGSQAAEVALRILTGEPAARITAPAPPASPPVYDWRALRRWGISESRLPGGGTIDFREPSLWDRYRWRIVFAAGVTVLQAILIVRLIVQRRRRTRAERALVQSERRLRTITNALPVLIAYVDADQRYRFNNEAYKTWFGASPGETAGRTVREVVGEKNSAKIAPHVARVLQGEHVRFTQEIELEDGRLIWVEAIYVPDVDEQGGVRGYYSLAMDVTERNLAQQESRRLQEELLHAGRIATMGELAGALAHEINQPLSGIMSNAQAALRYLSAPLPDLEEVKEILQDIVKDDARAGDVIKRLRVLLKKDPVAFETLDLNMVFRDVVGFLRSDAVIRHVEVTTDLDPRLPSIRGDRIQLQQLVLNLMVNAFDAVREQPHTGRRVLVRTWLKDSHILAVVSDSGTGIFIGDAEKIFTSFFTTKPQGLGMGLSTSRSIVSAHNGRLWVENNPDRGASFYISLPLP